MSGRLVILPHKSWNVWNQDNREKVLRDERLHREAEEAKAAREKQLQQEQNLEQLRSTGAENLTAVEDSESVVPFRLFEDLEKKHFAALGNEDYLKEKAAKELAQKKREGIADWALGEGSYESSGSKPWYARMGNSADLTKHADTASSSAGSRPNAIQRELLRKNEADPMGSLLVPNKRDYVPSRHSDAEHVYPACPPIEAAETKEDNSESDRSADSKRGRKRKHSDHNRKKRKRDKKDKKHKHDKDSGEDHEAVSTIHRVKEERATSKANHPAMSSGGNSSGSNSGSGVASSDPWAVLRQKRLEREATERKRAAQLLAEADIYGSAGQRSAGNGGGGREYSQQYNPHLARNNKY